MHVLQLLVCVLPPRREERAEDAPAGVGGGAEDLPTGGGLHRGLHWPKEGFRDLLLLHLFPLSRWVQTAGSLLFIRFFFFFTLYPSIW